MCLNRHTRDQRPDERSMPGRDDVCLERMRTSVLSQVLTSNVQVIAIRDLCPLAHDTGVSTRIILCGRSEEYRRWRLWNGYG